MFEKTRTNQSIAASLRSLSNRMRSIEAQVKYTKPEYTVNHGGYLIQDSAIGATSVVLNTYPQWSLDDKAWVLIDAGTPEAEIRRVTSVSDTMISFTKTLSYAHSNLDPVIFLNSLTINALWMGAKGDGSTDDILAINRGITQFKAITSKGVLYLPAGDYYVSGEVYVDTSCEIIGEGVDKTFISSASVTNGINVVDTTGVKITRLTIRQAPGGNSVGVRYYHTSGVAYQNILEGVVVDGFLMTGLYFYYQTNARISRCVVKNCGGSGMYLRRCERIFVSQNTVNDCTYRGIYLILSETSMVSNNNIYNCGQITPAYAPQAILLEDSNRGLIQNNTIKDCKEYISIDGSKDWICSGNTIYDTLGVATRPPVDVLAGSERTSVFGNIFPQWSSAWSVQMNSTDLIAWNNIEPYPQTLMGDGVRGRTNTIWSEWIPAEAFIVVLGTATQAVFGSADDDGRVWQFNNSAHNGIGVWTRIKRNLYGYDPANGFSIGMTVVWALVSNSAGNVRLNFTLYSGNVATDPYVMTTGLTISGAGTAGQTFITRCPSVSTVHNIDYGVRIRVGRNGAHAEDTAGSDIYILGLLLTVDKIM